MSGELHEVSTAIGELRAAMQERTRQNEAIFRKLDEIARNTADLPQIRQRLADIEPIVERCRRFKWVGIGLLASMGTAAGALGDKITALLDRFDG